ncbi:MAG: MBL fold metallo-hydrolase [Blastocatellia bacterium AA13]|nr:MAG: MBL fold metallo-hydrolase [Blastocatellia bacterium AA13]
MTTLTFLGAAGTVTGSKHLLESNGARLLVDTGLFQGFKELRLRNWDTLPIAPRSINWVVLTHAHIDHSGYLPRLVRDGFSGPVYCTKGTADLLQVVLPDSARLQEEDAAYANRRGYSKHKPAAPLYTEADAFEALKLVQGAAYGEPVRLGKHLSLRFTTAGHILGSSVVSVDVDQDGQAPIKVVFSGDLGRYDEPILNDPSPVPEADFLLIESTYGDRLHEDANPKEQLALIINETVKRGGKVIIPAFAVGRTQLLVYYLRELEEEGRIPVLPVAVDSPMAASATRLYGKHHEDHDSEMERLDEHKKPLATKNFSLVQGRAGSKALDSDGGPAIVISASGMATGGRVLHHLAQFLPDPASSVVLVGYQAAGTRGRRLQDGETEIKIHGEIIPVRASIEAIGSLSAHADWSEIMRWLSGFKRPPKRTFIVHGEPPAASALKERIVRDLGWNVMIPAYQESVELT